MAATLAMALVIDAIWNRSSWLSGGPPGPLVPTATSANVPLLLPTTATAPGTLAAASVVSSAVLIRSSMGASPSPPSLGKMPTHGPSRKREGRRLKAPSMPEVAHPGEHHRQPAFVGGGNHVLVADGATGLDDGGGAGFCRRDQAVGEGEECV